MLIKPKMFSLKPVNADEFLLTQSSAKFVSGPGLLEAKVLAQRCAQDNKMCPG